MVSQTKARGPHPARLNNRSGPLHIANSLSKDGHFLKNYIPLIKYQLFMIDESKFTLVFYCLLWCLVFTTKEMLYFDQSSSLDCQTAKC